jgi:phosphate transport system substrate-binding protein
MKLSSFPALAFSTGFIICTLCAKADEPVRLQGVAALTRVMKAAAPQLRELDVEIKVEEECTNARAVAALGNGEIDLALLGRTLTAEERASYPDKFFEELRVGDQTIVLLASRAIWESGVRALQREQIMEIYEGRVPSWKRFGGEDRSPKFFEPAHGYGVWEIFVTWLYGDARKAPAVPWDVVADGAEAQTAVQFHTGAVSVAAARWADRREAFPLAIVDATGAAIEPTPENVTAGKYPLTRPAFVVIGNKPTGSRRKVLEFLRSEKGQALMTNNDLLPVVTTKEP